MKNNLILKISLLIIIFCVSFLLRLKFVNVPLDRDSCAFLLGGYRFLHDGRMYVNFFDNKPPGIFLLLSIFIKLFSVIDLFKFNIFISLYYSLNTAIIFILTYKLLGLRTSIISSILFGIFSSLPVVEGRTFSTETCTITFVMIGIYIYFALKDKFPVLTFVLSGFFVGLGFTFKQSALFDASGFIIYFLIDSLLKNKKIKKFLIQSLLFATGFILPSLVWIGYFSYKGCLEEWWYYVFLFNFKYVKTMGYVSAYWKNFYLRNLEFIKDTLILWLGVIYFLYEVAQRKTKCSNFLIFILIWMSTSFVSVCFSGRFFPHYYMSILPSLSIICGFSIEKISFSNNNLRKIILLSLGGIAFFFTTFYKFCPYYFLYTPKQKLEFEYGWEPFWESYIVGVYLRKHTPPQQSIFVWAEEPEIFFYAQRDSCCKYYSSNPFVYFFKAMKENPLQELMEGLTLKKPYFFVIDSRFLPILKRFSTLVEFLKHNYYFHKKIDVCRKNRCAFSLIILKRVSS